MCAWIRAQNAVTNGYLEKLTYRETLRKRITELWDYPKVSLPYREGGRVFYRKNSGLQKQSVLYVRRSLSGPPRVVLDPNKLWPDGSTALAYDHAELAKIDLSRGTGDLPGWASQATASATS